MAFLVLSGLQSVIAQTETGKIQGTISENQKVDAATVSLLRAKDSSVVKLNVADKSGNYAFENVPAGRYLLLVTSVGFEKVYTETIDLTGSQTITIKPVQLVQQTKALAGVTVTSKKPLVEQKIDRTIINVEAAVTNVGSSALEVLEKSPGISVDKDGNISLKGKAGVVVLIDGRPTQLGAEDLANMLRSMQASQLDQIEIMTNPPAKFDASGNAGVINIKTKKNKQFGYNGSVTLGYGQGRYPKTNEGFNGNYRNNKVNLFANLSHAYRTNYNTLTIQRNFRDVTTKELLSHFDQTANMQMQSNAYNAKVGMDYTFDKKTSAGFTLSGFSAPGTFSNRNYTSISDEFGMPNSQTTARLDNNQTFRSFGTNLNFRRVTDTSGGELTSDLDFNTYKSRGDQVMVNSYFDANGNPTVVPDTLLAALPQHIKIYSGRIDYFKPLKKGMRFEAGIKSSIVTTDNNAKYDSVLNGQQVPDLNRTNHFLYEENINAAYVNFSAPLSKKLNAQLGLRAENTNANGDQITQNKQFDRKYTQVFPTAYLQYLANDKHSFVLNYGRRIRRPNYESLNPFIRFLDRYTYMQGNPELKPQFSHNIELSHSFKGSITTTLNYSKTTDIIQQVMEQNEAKNETFVKQANIASQRQLGASVNISMPMNKWWTNNFYVNVFDNKFDGIINNDHVTVSAVTLNLNGSQQFKFAKTWTGEVSGFFRTTGLDGVIKARSMGQMSLGLSKQILKNNGPGRVNVRDVFYTQKFRGETKYSNIDAQFQEVRDSRVLNVGFSYRFNKGKMNGAPKKKTNGSSTEEQSRVGGGN